MRSLSRLAPRTALPAPPPQRPLALGRPVVAFLEPPTPTAAAPSRFFSIYPSLRSSDTKNSSSGSSPRHPAGAKAPSSGPSGNGSGNGNVNGNGNPEIPTASLSQLGLSKRMRITLLVILSVFGTMETIFYCKAVWRWWQNRGKDEE